VPVMGRERLEEIKAQLPLILRRHKLTRLSVLTIYGRWRARPQHRGHRNSRRRPRRRDRRTYTS